MVIQVAVKIVLGNLKLDKPYLKMKLVVILLTITISYVVALSKNELSVWFEHVQNLSTNCRPTVIESTEGRIPLVNFVNCDEKNAIYRYKMASASSKKFKKEPLNGYTKITFAKDKANEKFNFGMRTGKCVLLADPMIKQISGNFVKDKLQVN